MNVNQSINKLLYVLKQKEQIYKINSFQFYNLNMKKNVLRRKKKMKVKATNEYVKRNVSDAVLGRIPQEGEEFEVTEERYKILAGKNDYKAVFVEAVIETAKKETKTEKAVKKTTKKNK